MLDTRRLSLRIPERVYNNLENYSQKTGNPVSSVVRQALNEFFSKGDEKK